MTVDQIIKFVDSLDDEVKAIKENIIRMCWFMRGSISYNDGMMLSDLERNTIHDLIKENLEATEKTNLPFF